MDEGKKVTGFWSSLEKHPWRTLAFTLILVNGFIKIFGKD